MPKKTSVTKFDNYDWSQFCALTPERVMLFRKELFADINKLLWKEVSEKKDTRATVSVFLQLMNDFPMLKDIFDNYLLQFEGETVAWSNEKVILRFLKRMEIVYDSLEKKYSK